MRRVKVDLTTDTAGAATGYGDSAVGSVYAIQLIDGDFADNVDVAITSEQESLSIPILTLANFNTDQMVYPRVPTAAVADGAALTNYAEPLCYGRPKVVIAQGGSVKSGSVILYIRESL